MRPDGSYGGGGEHGRGQAKLDVARSWCWLSLWRNLSGRHWKMRTGAGWWYFPQIYMLTCVSFVVTNESFGEEPDHQGYRSEKGKERGLNLALELDWSAPHPPPVKQLSQRKPASHQVKFLPSQLDPSRHMDRGLEGMVNYSSVQLKGSFGPPPPLSQAEPHLSLPADKCLSNLKGLEEGLHSLSPFLG